MVVSSVFKLTVLASDSGTAVATDFSKKTKATLTKVAAKVRSAEKTPSKQTVTNAINAFTNIQIQLDDIQAHEHLSSSTKDDKFDKLLLRIIVVINKLPEATRNKEFVYLDKKLIDSWWGTYKGIYHEKKQGKYNSFYYNYVFYLNDTIKIPAIQKNLKDAVIEVMNRPNSPENAIYHGAK